MWERIAGLFVYFAQLCVCSTPLSHSANYCSFGVSLKSGSETYNFVPSQVLSLRHSALPTSFLLSLELLYEFSYRLVYSSQTDRTLCFGKNCLDPAVPSKGNLIISTLRPPSPERNLPVWLLFPFFPLKTLSVVIIIIGDMGEWVHVLWCAHGSQLYEFGSLLLPFCEDWEWHLGLQACLTSTYTHWVISPSQAFKTLYWHI